ncbi:putative transposase [Drepanopeziza brunnea f. sp. 'multigermtubi' MB_m1]|uniref:Putative transposase n=1 Tax=Marssonina brunnea f. sp. multigermtubi (strain MB_m1) TaxID=1072389 RepID=K1WH53_MARBU|nr:putative transposase [Drepanopeziza brunnea f. sp. 'multigermtubi' MB_m1]EKD16925.1 putative transposase [Drepanopeziza brunnea f. sp. 'multigermtubi' MB_m1]
MSREKIMSRFNAKNRGEPSQHKRIQLAFEWLLENPSETLLTASRIHMIEKPDTLKRRWNKYQAKQARLKKGKALQVGRLIVLSAAQHKAVLIYAADQATKGGKRATKQLYAIRTKPIASYRVDMHTEKSLSNWFYTELVLAIQFCGIKLKDKHRIANIDEKGARICMPAGEEVIVPIGIKEMYTGIYENRLSVTMIEAILADRKAIPLMIIMPGKQIIASWFSEKMTRHKVVTVSESGYTNDRITIDQLCHEASNFILLAKQNRIWLIKFPSYQTHLLQPFDVSCFRTWKHNQQCAIMDAIRGFEAEYTISSFMRDLLQIREQTFTTQNIKHAFRDAKIKKSKKEAGLHILEYGETSDLEEDEYSFSIDKQPDELPLPALPRPPQSFQDCVKQLDDLNDKIRIALSSPSRQRFDIAKQELDKNQKLQRDTHRKKLIKRSSLQTGENILASKALEKVKAIEIKKQEASLKIANAKLKSATIKIRNDRYNQGLNEAYKQQSRGIPIHIPPEREVLIRDREKQPTAKELEANNIDLISFRDAVVNEKAALKEVQERDLATFADPSYSIDP